MSRSLFALQPLRNAVSRQATPSASTASRVLAARARTYSTETDKKDEAATDAKDENAEKIANLESKVKELEKEILYGRAEVQTMNRRVIDERNKASEFAISKFAQALLSTSDVLTTALSHVKQPIDESNTELKSLFSGVDMTQKQLINTFGHHGVKKFEKTVGEKFDPNLHEATFQVPKEHVGMRADGKAYEAGEVFEVQKEGWMIGNRVLRPAQVGVTQME